jgi:hypothetical protein
MGMTSPAWGWATEQIGRFAGRVNEVAAGPSPFSMHSVLTCYTSYTACGMPR